jgi:hypothetical protein
MINTQIQMIGSTLKVWDFSFNFVHQPSGTIVESIIQRLLAKQALNEENAERNTNAIGFSRENFVEI